MRRLLLGNRTVLLTISFAIYGDSCLISPPFLLTFIKRSINGAQISEIIVNFLFNMMMWLIITLMLLILTLLKL